MYCIGSWSRFQTGQYKLHFKEKTIAVKPRICLWVVYLNLYLTGKEMTFSILNIKKKNHLKILNTFLINRIFYPLQNPSGAPQSLFLCRNNSEEFGIVLHKSNWKLIDLNEYLLLLMSTWVVFILMFPFNIPRSWIKVATAASLRKSLKASTSSTLRTFTSSTWRKFLSAIVLWKVLVSSVPLEPERQKPHRKR